MLNRRKQTLDADGQSQDERAALLDSLDSPDYYAPNHLQDDRLTSSANITVPIAPRKARAKSPEPRYQGSTPIQFQNRYDAQPSSDRSIDATSQAGYWSSDSTRQQYQGDSYELNRLNGNSTQTRAVISITGNDSYYKHPSTDFILYTIQPGDTLHNLSVKYSCPVASIKRLNNLWSDRDFYGLSKIKLPVGRLRLLADVLGEELDGAAQPSRGENQLDQPHDSINSLLGYSNQSHAPPPFPPQERGDHKAETVAYLHDDNSTGTLLRADTLFKNLDQHINKAREAAKSYDDNANDIMQTLALGGNLVSDDQEDEAANAAEKLPDLADFGLSYNFLILFIFIVCLVCPLAYVIYHEETHRDTFHHDSQHHESNNDNHKFGH